MLRIRDWRPAALAAVLVLALAAPAWGHHPAGESVTAQSAGPSDLLVERHGDPVSQFKDGANDPVEPEGSISSRAASPSICPTVNSTVDDGSNDPHGGSAAVVKVIYAHPVDVGNRLANYGPVIGAGIKSVAEIVAAESGGTMSIRFDIGTFEGPHCLDLQRVALSQTSSYYSSLGADGAFETIADEVTAQLGPQGGGGARNYLVYADLVAPDGVAGVAEASINPGVTDRPSSGSIHNQGGYFAQLFGRGGSDFFGSQTAFPAGTTSRLQADVALHEVTHNLGGVQLSAPRSSGAGHCNDQYDVLCYEDGGSGTLFVDPRCNGNASLPADPYGPGAAAWDCNKDDYFNPNPAPGSYLDTHWNIADSAFLCAIAACTPPDAQPPNTTLDAVPRRSSRSQQAKVRFRSSERGSFSCKLDGRKPRRCSSPFKIKVKRGKHLIRITATDASGLRELSPAQTRFRVLKPR